VRTTGDLFDITAADGSFAIPGVPTAFGNIKVLASFTDINGAVSQGGSEYLSPVRGGITNVGQIQLSSCLVMSPLPLSGWPAEGDAIDVYGLNNGLLLNGVSFAPGVVGQSFSLDGFNDSIRVNDAPEIDFTGPFSLEAWVKVNAFRPANSLLFWKGNNLGHDRTTPYALGILTDGVLGSRTGVPVGTIFGIISNGTSPIYFSSATQIPLGLFTHIALVVTGSTVELYINGQLETQTPQTVNPYDSPYHLQIGAIEGNVAHTLNGSIDELAVYNRVLTSTDIQEIFTGGLAGMGKCRP
jgi:hypothetical protein